MKLTSSVFLLSIVLSAGMTSCVDPSFGGGGYGGGYGGYGSNFGNAFGYGNGAGYGSSYPGGYGNGGFNSYTTLPSNFNGNAYNHNGLYYTGGKYQTGSYSYQGQPYSNRYYHNGQYYYGGSHQNYSPQQTNGYNANVNVNTPVLQQHMNSQFLQR